MKIRIIAAGMIIGLMACWPVLSQKKELTHDFSIEIKGTYGCVAGVQYVLQINNSANGCYLLAKNGQNSIKKKLSRDILLQIQNIIDSLHWDKIPNTIGDLQSTADFTGTCKITYLKGDNSLSKMITFKVGRINNPEFEKIYTYLMNLMDEKYRIPMPNFG